MPVAECINCGLSSIRPTVVVHKDWHFVHFICFRCDDGYVNNVDIRNAICPCGRQIGSIENFDDHFKRE